MELRGKSWIIAKSIYIVVKRMILKIISLTGLFSAIYYGFFSQSYSREQRAVIAGLKQHMIDLKGSSSLFLLRRNIHRIEKGLVMPNRKPIFAREYIGETVDFYFKCLNDCTFSKENSELVWARDILISYFDAVQGDDPLVEKAWQQFFKIEKEEVGLSTPYARGNKDNPVKYEELLALSQLRKSVRTYEQKTVPRELVDKALHIASFSPSSCNRQPVHYRIFDEPELLRKVSRLPLGAKGFCENIPMICAVTGDLSAYFYERDRHSIYVDGCLSAMLFMLALETVGLGSCPLNWAEIDSLDKKLENLIKIPSYERAIMFIAVGYPDPNGNVAYSERKDLELLRSYNKIGN